MITHHIAANVDADRDKLIADLALAISSTETVEGFHSKHDGRNGGGDPYHTDGRLLLGVLESAGTVKIAKLQHRVTLPRARTSDRADRRHAGGTRCVYGTNCTDRPVTDKDSGRIAQGPVKLELRAVIVVYCHEI